MASDGDADLLWSMEHPDACSTCETVISSNNRCRCSPEARLSARVEKLESVLKFVDDYV